MNRERIDEIPAFVPSLTRHAQLLTGSSEAAGEYVRLCLELLAAEPYRLDDDDVRFCLFRAFHRIWAHVHDDAELETPLEIADRLKPATRHKGNTLERRIFLLTDIEGFPSDCVAEILAVCERAVTSALATPKGEFRPIRCAPALIVEDDPLMAMHINEITQEVGLTVTHVANNVQDAVFIAPEKMPAIALVDVQLRRGECGLKAARAIIQRHRIPVIFITGYPWMLESADGLYPAVVVPKPFRAAMLKSKIATALRLYSEPARAADHQATLLAKFNQLLAQQDWRSPVRLQ
jgi:CheY-like chemotaxis protein